MIKFKPVWRRKLPENSSLKPRLTGGRILLQAPCLQDYEEWAAVREKNKDFLTPYEPKWAEQCLTRSFYKKRLRRQEKEWQAGRGAFFFIHHQQTGQIIGGINLNDIRYGAARHASLGYWLDQNHQGQGYMNEAAQLVIYYAFHVLGLRRLNAACLPDNDRSIRLLNALGFEEEGYAPKYLQINGTWQDHKLFGFTSLGQ